MPFFALAGSSIVSAGIGALGASSAANAQKNAANNQLKFNTNLLDAQTTREAPFLTPAYGAVTDLANLTGITSGGGTGPLNAPFNPADLANTPGYKFTLQQGEEALTDQASATGGIGGNTLKAILGYGQGLASTTYQQQLEDYMAQQQQQFNQLTSIANQGQNAISGIGGAGATASTGVNNAIAGIGNAQSAGIAGVTNAVTGGINNLSNNYLLSSLLGGGSGGAGPGGSYFSAADAQGQAQAALLAG